MAGVVNYITQRRKRLNRALITKITMKIQDLMIGDNVQVVEEVTGTPFVCRVISINADHIGLDGQMGACSLPIERIQPILLTSAILEKNGCKLLEVGDNGAATPVTFRNRYEKWELRTTWIDTFLWYDRIAKYWHLQDMGAAWLHYVHELQHALRLRKIDKEIIL